VRRDAGQLRVTVELVDGATGMVAWSRSYDAPFARLLAVQGEIAADVAAALSVALVHSDRPASLQQAQAHDLFLHGRYLFNRRAPGDLPTAERRLEQAVRLDPGHARAWTALAGAYFVRAIEELDDPAYRLHEQGVALENALRLDPLLAEAHLRQSCYFELAGAPDLARAAAERARRLSPRDPLVLGAAAARAVMDGRLDDAIADQRAMVEIDPLSAVNRNNYGRTLLGAGRFVEGLAELRRAAELSSHPDTLLDIARVLLLLDRGDEVRGLLDRLPAGPPRDQILVLLDPHPEGDRASDRLQADATLRGRRLRAEIAAFRGDADAAFEQLHAALPGIGAGGRFSRARDECIEITLSPYLCRLHADPRWSQLMADLRAL
jgi:Tfp pilus assembly protein PilF